MKIGEVETVTQHYISKKGNDYKVVKIELLEISEKWNAMYNPKMYGTINYDYITDGALNRDLCLANFSIGKTVAEALQNREESEAIQGLSFEEVVAYFQHK